MTVLTVTVSSGGKDFIIHAKPMSCLVCCHYITN